MDRKEVLLEQFAKAILAEAKEKNLSLRKLADASGLEYSQVQRIAKGKVNLALTSILALCEGLNISPSSLFGRFDSFNEK
jgi:transcriptional regulator with XRE-family HTH domain